MEPTRAAGLARLTAFTPLTGRAYADGRNHDPGPGKPGSVSALSPFIRHRLITEQEVVASAIAAHGAEVAGKFIQEVFWRSYWKGWLAQRPAVWDAYRARVVAGVGVPPEGYEVAIAGQTGIACFDAWVQELIETGYLHNHARMWFASIWIFTLRLPWFLGADFFLQHLLDGDAASNTLSWRWVAGLHTKGKHYVARAENIARHTGGRFAPHGALNEAPAALQEPDPPAPRPMPNLPTPPPGPVVLLLHEDDLHPESLPLEGLHVRRVLGLSCPEARSPLGAAQRVRRFVAGAIEDGLRRGAEHFGVPAEPVALYDLPAILAREVVVMPETPIGWLADALRPYSILSVRRPWDTACWPLAARGFFPFAQHIPRLCDELIG
ncbi:MAG: deoxyribodipyrimidine photolyase [Roseomonas sp.]|nr:deoxyribodipyrimidine photolyase [Roseomonas sp.]MCA3327386.1 deoxyribodipyrimidine photolyase [Roseomonas sp.]MCA3330642.1 deoxyribodipyrimidine photolyase [Roseomonas sp.]MCA3333230.1 deoxyribodipyrimidine photolyase [Roseomonas sp.]MCA3345995.1 deoxyribodipyrimidine photolyase [Roseomonas sp.]